MAEQNKERKDFARIVRASNGQQVLFFVDNDAEEECDVLHQIAHFDGFSVDMKMQATEKGTEKGSAYKWLEEVDVKWADALIREVETMMGLQAAYTR